MYLDFDFNYEIISVDIENNHMQVKFSAQGKEDLFVGTTLPLVGDDLTRHVVQFLPVSSWLKDTREFNPPAVGTTGTFNSAEHFAASQAAAANANDEMIKRLEDLVVYILTERGIIT